MDSFNPTTKAQQAISAAVQAAALAGNPDVGPTHLLGATASGEGARWGGLNWPEARTKTMMSSAVQTRVSSPTSPTAISSQVWFTLLITEYS